MKKILHSAFIAAMLLIVSACQNGLVLPFFDNLEAESQILNSETEPEYVIFTGDVQIGGGAAPQVLVNPLLYSTSDPAARSAIPTLTGTYFATATATGKTPVQGQFGSGANAKNFEIKLERGYNWNLTCGVKDASDNVLLQDSITVDLRDGTPELTHTFAPQPVKTGTGSIQLPMKVPVDSSNEGYYVINRILAEWVDSRGPQSVEINASEIDSNGETTLSINDVPSGCYNFYFTFYVLSAIPVYTEIQAINVFDNLTTNTWVYDHSACLLNGTFELTQVTLVACNRNTFYIGDLQIKDSNGNLIGKRYSDDNQGTPYEPLETLEEAFIRAERNAKADAASSWPLADYIFYIYGTVKGTTTISDYFYYDSGSKKIIIKGYQGLGSDGKPQDCLDADLGEGETGATLTINCGRNVVIQNLRITGGNNPGNGGFGGGISCNYDSSDETMLNVNLTNCEITGNTAEYGGGISLQNNVVVELIGTSIHDNTATDSGGGIIACCDENCGPVIKEDTSISSNTARFGGGITLEYGKLDIRSGTISENEASRYGGAIELHESGTLLMSGGTISRNRATGERDDYGDFLSEPNNGNGGGIFIYDISPDEVTVKISGGEIKQNTAEGPDKQGGAIYFCGGLVNEDYGDGTCMSISGGVHIPYGDSQGNKAKGKNDVYLVCWTPLGYEDYAAVVVVDGPLTSHNASDKIRLESDGIARGDVVVRPDGTHVTDLTNYVDCFDFGDDDWFVYMPSASVDKIAVNSPIFVSGSSNASDTTGDGTRAHPYETIDKAVKTMNSATMDYFIGIDGSVKGKQTIKKSYGDLEINAGSITLQGVNGLYESGAHIGEPKDVLNGNYSDVVSGGYTLGIILPCNVTIKNLKITGGKNASVGIDCGGGIYCYNYFDNTTCKLIIDEGTLITGNHSQNGGGIYLRNKANLVMQGGTIKNNTLRTNYSNGSAICCDSNSLITIKDDAKIEGDIYLKGNKLTLGGSLSKHSSTSPVTISVDNSNVPRGTTVVESETAMAETDINSFNILLPTTEWNTFVSADKKQIIINAPIYVAGSDHSSATGAPSASGSGSASSPLNSLSAALALCNNAASQYIIKIDGTLIGTNAIAVANTAAASILLEGVQDLDENGMPKDVLNGNETGSTLTVSGNAPVTIKKLKITGGTGGGSGTGSNNFVYRGGGIDIQSGATVILDEHVVITGNTATFSPNNAPEGRGGGIANAGTLIARDALINGNTTNGYAAGIYNCGTAYIYGTTVIGDESKKNDYAELDDFGNKAYGSQYVDGWDTVTHHAGGGISSEKTGSKLYLGYNENGEESEWAGGIYHNYGGGVYVEDSEFKMSSGTISGNHWGGIYFYRANNPSISGGLITKNDESGGGIYLYYSVLTMTGGVIKGNEVSGAANDVDYNTESNYTKLILSGSSSIGNTWIKDRNSNHAPLYIAGALELPEGVTESAILSSSNYRTGEIIVVGEDYTVTAQDMEKIKFSFTNPRMEIFPVDEEPNKYCVDAPIYVAGADHSSKTGAPSDSWGSDVSDRGSKAKPFASIEGAITLMNDPTATYTVLIDGTLTEGQRIVNICSSNSISTQNKASEIVLKGLNGLDENGIPKDSITCNYSETNPGTVLTLVQNAHNGNYNDDYSTVRKLTIRDLKLAGGYNPGNDSASGIYAETSGYPTLQLYGGTYISSNAGHAVNVVYPCLRGSAYIPTNENGSNDIYLRDNYSKLYYYGELTKHSAQDTVRITPYTYYDPSDPANVSTKAWLGIEHPDNIYTYSISTEKDKVSVTPYNKGTEETPIYENFTFDNNGKLVKQE